MAYQFLVDTYETVILKVLSVWSMFDDQDLTQRSHKDGVEKIGGQAPQSLEGFVRAHRTEFTGGPELSRQAQREMRKS